MDAREEMLEAASESSRFDSVGRILEEISQNSKFREELGDGLASEAVSLCRSSSAAERIQSILVSACVVESNLLYHNDATIASDLLLELCEALSKLLLSYHAIFYVSRKAHEEAFLKQTSKLVVGASLPRSTFSSFLLVDAFNEVALFSKKYEDVNPDLSFPAILYAHLVFDIGSDASSPDGNMHRQIIQSYALLLDGNQIDPELFKHSQSLVNGISTSDFDACVAPTLCGTLESITTTSAAKSCLQSCSNFIELLIICRKGQYLEYYCSDDGIVSIMVDTSMELLIQMKTEDVAFTVSNLINATVQACRGLGLVKVSEALLDALNVDASVFANSQECQGFVKQVTSFLHQVALAGLDFLNQNDDSHDDSYTEELVDITGEIIQTLRVMGEETNADALPAWEEVYSLIRGAIENGEAGPSIHYDAVEPTKGSKIYEDEDWEKENEQETEQIYEIPGITEISVSVKDRKEERVLGIGNKIGKDKQLDDEDKNDEPTKILMESIQDKIHAKLKACKVSNVSASNDNMDQKVPAKPFSSESATSAAVSPHDLDAHCNSTCGEPIEIHHRSYQGTRSVEDKIHAKLKACNVSNVSASNDNMDHAIFADSNSAEAPSHGMHFRGKYGEFLQPSRYEDIATKKQSESSLNVSVSATHTNLRYSDSSQSNLVDSQISLLASETRENIRIDVIDRRINSKLNTDGDIAIASLPLSGMHYVPCEDENESQTGSVSSNTSKSDDFSIEDRIKEENEKIGQSPQRDAEAIILQKISHEHRPQENKATSLQQSSRELNGRISNKTNPSTRRFQHIDAPSEGDSSGSHDREYNKRVGTETHQSAVSKKHYSEALLREPTTLLIKEADELSEPSRQSLLHQRTSGSERLALLNNEISDNPASNTIVETAIAESPKSSNEDIVVAMALEEGETDDLDEAVNYDPNSKKKLGQAITRWTLVAIVAAIAVAVILIVLLSKKKLKANKDEITYAPSVAPSSVNEGEISRLIIDRFGSGRPYYDMSTAYGKAFDWITQDENASEMIDLHVLGKVRRRNELSPLALYQRFFCGLFYYEMKGDGWLNCSASFDFHNETCTYVDREDQVRTGRSKWLSNVDVCAWAGISCDSNKLITVLDLNHLGLYGMIPAEIGELKELETLSLINNLIHGHIPTAIGKLSKLLDVDLHINRLDGEIPYEFYSLSRMLTFNLGYNDLSGTLAPQIGNMIALKGFHLKENSFSGPIPREIGGLGDLHYLTLSGNSFTDLPREFEQLTKLRSLYLDKNMFIGPLYLPVAEELEELIVDNNNFNEPLPENLYKLKNLKYFVANNNAFTGILQPEIGGLTVLRLLRLRDNDFEGNLPSSMKNLLDLVTLSLNFNSFSGNVPSTICDLYKKGNLVTFISDCKNDLSAGDPFYGTGKQKLKCPCCTDCCDPGIESDCQPVDTAYQQSWMP